MIDNRTTNLNLPLPHQNNALTDDVYRLRDAITGIDTAVANANTAIAGKAATSHNHDGVYSATNHNHDSAYSALGHNHSGTYEPVDTNIVRKNAANSFTGAQTMDGGLIITDEVRETPVVANTGDAYTITITGGTLFDLTLNPTTTCTFTFPIATAGRQFTIILNQTGSKSVAWPSSVRWPSGTAPTITATASRADVISFIADGAYWLGFLAGQAFTRS